MMFDYTKQKTQETIICAMRYWHLVLYMSPRPPNCLMPVC
uniref:Uncharacterized protein n=1 Tax=Anguilla anguilla TaxID=7936 RepID=A0A0E9TGV9_ANGAN